MESLFDPAVLTRIRASAEADARTKPLAHTRSDVPWAINGVTREWLDDCIGQGAGKPAITAIDVTPFSSGTSVRGTIRAEREDGETLNLFAKTYPSFEHRVANILTRTAQAEGRFYMEVRASLDIEAPTGYHWSADEEKFRAIVVIDDLSVSKSDEFCNFKSSVNRTQVESAMLLLARLHGKFLGDAGLGATFPWMCTYADWSVSVTGMRQEHLRAMDEARDVIPSVLHDAANTIFDKFLAVRAHLPEVGHTIIHSDVHLGNWYKTREGKLGLCDWQCLSIGDPCRDLAYAISTLLEVEDRRAWENGLIRLYVDTLSEESGKRIDFDAFFQAYRRWLPAALLMWTPTLVPAPDFPAMQPREMSMKMIQRTTAAIADHHSLEVA